ncbi:hypothetical protein RF11_11262 [Thelohanellus kitauei]|uniref:Uncharacterized protein n=1 Tax=Thelohanellus kitauei TaxID=669202 RepID=A0A0C2IWD5_THEKT|nr:hypothetical protein RF11_11262 [Thelohanellus kitauei]
MPSVQISQTAFKDKDEHISLFLGRLLDMKKNCDFKDTFDERLGDEFIIGINNPEVKKELICRFKSSASDLNEVIEFENTLADAEANVENILRGQATTEDKFIQHITGKNISGPKNRIQFSKRHYKDRESCNHQS